MKKELVFWGEKFLFSPGPFEKFLSFLLYPLSLVYCLLVWYKYKKAIPKSYGIPVISVGNLIVGGSGKTPLSVALAKAFDNVAIVLRGYGRESKGMYLISDGKKILHDVGISGDEAMLYATLLPQAFVIVAEDREEGILKAKSLGAKLVFLDDAYSKHSIEKLDLLIVSEQRNRFCLPAGPFRERLWEGKKALSLQEEKDFFRKVHISSAQQKMVLVTAISKPQRLNAFLNDNVIEKVYFPDHYVFDRDELEEILKRSQADSILVTRKDAVKMQGFDLPLSYLELEIEVSKKIQKSVEEYVKIAAQK